MEIFNSIVTYFSGTWGMVELLGTIASLICVYLATKHNQWTWFFGAIGVILFGSLFYEFKLYSDAGLQILFFLPVQLWGFMVWRNMAESSGDELVTVNMELPLIFLVVMGILGMTLINGYFMSKTDASFPYIDAWTTWMSIAAQILMVKKYWQSWIFWVTMDVVAIGVYYAKGLYVVSGLYVVFLILASFGLYAWKQNWNNQSTLDDIAVV